MNTQKKASATSTGKKDSKIISSPPSKKTKKTRSNAIVSMTAEKVTDQFHNTPSEKQVKKKSVQFESQMTKVNELIKEGKIRQAYSAIPSEEKYPENAIKIKALKLSLMDQIWKL